MGGNAPRSTAASAGELLGLAGTAALVVWIPFLTRPGATVAAVLVSVALLAGAAGTALDLLARAQRRGVCTEPVEEAPWQAAGGATTLIVLGDEPVELQHNTVVLAMAAGPCIVVEPRGRDIPDQVAALGVPSVCGESLTEAVDVALGHVGTDACLLVSGRAVPVLGSTDTGAMLGNMSWITALSEPIGVEHGAEDVGYEISSRLRGRAAAMGLALWEPNATVLRTELLRSTPLPAAGPRGSWLRSVSAGRDGPGDERPGRPRSGLGRSGDHLDRVVSAVAVPTSTSSFWAESVAQQSGFVADAASAVRTERGRARLAALLVLGRQLPIWALPAWMSVLLTGALSESVPFDLAGGLFPLGLLAVMVLRHVALHRSLGVPMRPRSQALAYVMRIPAVYSSVRSAATARVYASKPHVRPRPLLWIALLAAVIAVGFVVDDDGVRLMSPLVAVAAVLTLAVLWLVMIRVMSLKHWERVSMRIPLQTAVLVDHETGRAVDGSPDGLAVVLSDGQAAPDIGATSELVIDLGATVIAATGLVVHRRADAGRTVLGIRLELEGDDRRRWAAALLDAARSGQGPEASVDLMTWGDHEPTLAAPSRFSGWSERLALAGAGVMSLLLLGALVTAMLGVHTSVVRSASMDPTIPQGSLVFSVPEAVVDLSHRDVVTRPASGGELPVTHRFVSQYVSGSDVVVTTKGDANAVSETWTVPADSTVQRIVWHVPLIGTLLAAARSGLGLLLVGAVVLGLVIAAVRPMLTRPAANPAVS